MEKVLLSSRRRIFRLERNDIERISARNSGGCLVLNTAKGRRRAAFAYSGRRKIEIASLLNLTLEEAGTLKREREGEEYQATRASLAASNANRVLGEQGFVNFGTSRGCVKILAIKRSAREIQFPWEKRFQRSSLSLSLSLSNPLLLSNREPSRRRMAISRFLSVLMRGRNTSRFDRSKLLSSLSSYRSNVYNGITQNPVLCRKCFCKNKGGGRGKEKNRK